MESGDKAGADESAAAASDPELEELLEKSLGEFGTHIPATEDPPLLSTHTGTAPHPHSSSAASAATTGAPTLSTDEFEDIFSEEFAAQAEAQLNEAMQMLASENPLMWEQIQQLAKGGFGGEGGGGGGRPSKTSGEASSGPQSEGAGAGAEASLDAKLEETLRQLRERTEQIESGATAGGGTDAGAVPGLSDMLGSLDFTSDDGGEEGLMKAMTGMMDQLLSKEVLYPSLVDLCKQYPEWLTTHKDEISAEDSVRYGKQLEVMQAICGEFEAESERDSSEVKQGRTERVLQLMQQLHEYGQPPKDLASENYAGALPSMPDLESVQNCSLM